MVKQKDLDIRQIEFNVTIYFSNGTSIQRQVPLDKAVKLSMKPDILVPEDADYVEVKGVRDSLIVPVKMNFFISKPVIFKNTDKMSKYLLYLRDNGRCAYCGKPLTRKEATVDHVYPKSKGGKNTFENCVIACRPCNTKKDNRTPEEAGMRLLVKPYNPKKIKQNL